MSIFDKLFSKKLAGKEVENTVIRFGRYSDSYKTDENHDHWSKALEAFEEGDFLVSYQYFFQYLRDEAEDNVQFSLDEKQHQLQFKLFQGSTVISGQANKENLYAVAKIAKTDQPNLSLMRRLLERNYTLKYSRFGLDDDSNLCIIFDTYTLDGSPYKLYYALKELAVNADKQDDLLLDEFKGQLQSVKIAYAKPIPDQEKEIKYRFIKRSIQSTINEIERGELSPLQYPGATAYKLLSLTYKLDYLIKPEGYMMETLERIHRIYFGESVDNNKVKNQRLIDEYKILLSRPKIAFFKEFYRTTATFGITSPENHNRVSSFIEAELPNMGWYIDNNHIATALAIPEYIVGYCQFNYAVPEPDRDLFRLFYRITESEYFEQLGFKPKYYDWTTNKFDKKAIKKAIEQIRLHNQVQYPKCSPNTSKLRFDSLVQFSRSFLVLVKELNLIKRFRTI